MTLEELHKKLEPHWAEKPVWRYASIDEGWAPLVSRLIDALERTDPGFEVVQVKEKFGGLRFYTGKLSPEGRKVIAAAELASTRICEVCGKAGELTKYHTLCPTHEADFEERRAARWKQ